MDRPDHDLRRTGAQVDRSPAVFVAPPPIHRLNGAMASKKTAPSGAPANGVGIQVPAGRILANRVHWQTVLHAPGKPAIYRLFNAAPGNSLIVEVDRGKRPLRVDPGSSADVLARQIRVKAGTGGDAHTVEGWYVLVS
jgi:hypothetical protein